MHKTKEKKIKLILLVKNRRSGLIYYSEKIYFPIE